MVRIGAFLVGLFFAGWLIISFIIGSVAYIQEPPQPTVESVFHKHPKHIAFSFDGPTGHYDKQQLQRGFLVYKEVCSACHSIHQVAFRDLEALGYSPAEVKAIAKQGPKQETFNPVTGDRAERDSLPADKFPAVYYAGAGVPPDLSLIAKSRHGGAQYIASLLTGYQDQPAELLKQFPDAKTPDGLYYNPYFANLNIAMPAPLSGDGQVTYSDGTKATKEQMAKDVAAFLMWAAEPKLENRHRAGFPVLIFLVMATALAYLAYRNIWANKPH